MPENTHRVLIIKNQTTGCWRQINSFILSTMLLLTTEKSRIQEQAGQLIENLEESLRKVER